MGQPILSQIYIYPLKSARGIALERSVASERGLMFDRRWMVVDASGKFITQRTYPKMALISPEISTQTLNLNAPGMTQLSLPLFPKVGDLNEIRIWGDRCEAWSLNLQAETWISKYLGKKCKIVFMPDHCNRLVDTKYTDTESKISFSDGFPFMLISEASLIDLNTRLFKKVTMKRFRPNLVVKNTRAYEEDNWNLIRIGKCELKVVKSCSRCILTTIDPEKGHFDGKEPLKTMASFRRKDGKIMFGQNLIVKFKNEIKLGMEINLYK